MLCKGRPARAGRADRFLPWASVETGSQIDGAAERPKSEILRCVALTREKAWIHCSEGETPRPIDETVETPLSGPTLYSYRIATL